MDGVAKDYRISETREFHWIIMHYEVHTSLCIALSITLIVLLLCLLQYRLHHLVAQPRRLGESWRKVLLDPLESVPVRFKIAK